MINLRKKGQLEIGITMMVLLVFFILLIVALVVYFKFSYISIKETRQEILDEKFSTLVNSLTGLPEIKCSFNGAEKECLDAKKLIAFGSVLEGQTIREDYLDEFGIYGLEIDVVYPPMDGTLPDCVETPNSYPNCKSFTLISPIKEGLKYTTPVSLYYPTEKINKIGKLIITAEVK